MSLIYSVIDKMHLQGTVLDVGCGDFTHQMESKNRPFFIDAVLQKRYTGIDIKPNFWNFILREDIFELQIDPVYDLVMCLEMAEHIKIQKWPELFARLKGLVKKDGVLYVSVPYQEPKDSGMTDPNSQCPHVVFDIKAHELEYYLPDARITYHGRVQRQSLTPRRLLNLFIQVLRRNKHVNPYKPVWMLAEWRKTF